MLLMLTSCFFAGCGSTPAAQEADDAETTITLGDTVTIDGQGAAADGQQVTISQGGVYTLSGSLSDGQVLVDCADAVTLRLSGVTIANSRGPAVLFAQTADAQILLTEGTANALSDGSDAEYDAALYCSGSLTIDGSGSLSVTGNNQEGIASDENITINGGTLDIVSADDGINASHDGSSVITINGGTLTISAQGDGIDSNGSLTINGGTIISMSALTDMSGGIDTDGEFLLNGGTVLATGALNTLPSDQSAQAALSFSFKTTQEAGTPFTLAAEDTPLLLTAPTMAYQTLLYSSADLTTDGHYAVYTGGTAAEGILLDSSALLTDSIQQTHREAAEAGDFDAAGVITTFSSVTYLTDTDFTSAAQQPDRPDGSQPPQRPDGEQSPGPAPGSDGQEPPKPADGRPAGDGQRPPADKQAPASDSDQPTAAQ